MTNDPFKNFEYNELTSNNSTYNELTSNNSTYNETKHDVSTDDDSYDNEWCYVQNPNLTKWIPNEDLYIKYNNCSNEMRSINMTRINNLNAIITNCKEKYEKLSTSNDMYNRFDALEMQSYMYDCEIDLIGQENNFKYITSDFLLKWSKYLEAAKNFIVDNKLHNVVKIKDILSNNNLKIAKRRNTDGIIISKNKSIYADNIKKLNKYFDITE